MAKTVLTVMAKPTPCHSMNAAAQVRMNRFAHSSIFPLANRGRCLRSRVRRTRFEMAWVLIATQLPPRHEALRPEREEDDEHDEGDDVPPFAGQVPDAELLDHSQGESANDGAVEVSDAANHRGYPALQQKQETHPGLNGGVVPAEDSGQGGEDRADEEHDGDDDGRVDAHHFRDFFVVPDGPPPRFQRQSA